MSATSPNRRAHSGRVRIVNSRGFANRARSDPRFADQDARERFVEELGDRIRGLLCASAEAGVATRDPEYAAHTDIIDWGRTGIPQPVRRLGLWIIALGVCALGASAVFAASATRTIAEAIAGLAWIVAIDRASISKSETLVDKGGWHRRSR
jgi:hypothetical protein